MDVGEISLLVVVNDKASSALSNLASNFSRAQQSANGLSGGLDSLHGHLNKISAMGNVGEKLFAGTEKFLGAILEPTKEMMREIAKMNTAGLNNIEIAKNVKTAWQSAAAVPGTTVSGGLESLNDIRQILVANKGGKADLAKSYAEARELHAPAMMAQQIFASLNGGDMKRARDEVAAAFKFSEMRGHLSLESQKSDLSNLATTAVATGGKVMPYQMMQGTKFLGGGKQTLSDSFYFSQFPELIIENATAKGGGASRAGVMVQAMLRNLAQGHMDKKLQENLAGLGLLNNAAMSTTTTGTIIKGMNPIKGFDPSNPLAWVPTMLDPALIRAHPEIAGHADLLAQYRQQTMSGSNTFSSIIMEAANKQPAFAKLDEARKQVGTMQQANDRMRAQSPDAAEKAFDSSLTNLATAIGASVMPIIVPALNTMAGAITQLALYAKDHPEFGKQIIDTAVGLGTLGLALVTVGGIAGTIKNVTTVIEGLAAIPKFVVGLGEFFPEVILATAGIAVLGYALTHWSDIMDACTVAVHNNLGLLRGAYAGILVLGDTFKNNSMVVGINSIAGAFNSFFATIFAWANKIPGVHLDAPSLMQQANKTSGDWAADVFKSHHVADPFAGWDASSIAKGGDTKVGPTINIQQGAIAVHQQPGQDPKKIAEHVIEEIRKQMAQGIKSTASAAGDLQSWGFNF